MGKQKNKPNNNGSRNKPPQQSKEFWNHANSSDGLSKQLRLLGFAVKEMVGDGNCLFRALGDQYEGHCRNHIQLRLKVVDYIKSNRCEFEPFIEDDVPFEDHVKSLAAPGTYGGNDAIVAFARLFNVTVVIHQFDSPAWVIHPGPGNSKQSNRELHISYHNGDHYNSVVKINGAEHTQQHSLPESSTPIDANNSPKEPLKKSNGKAMTVKSMRDTSRASPPKIENLSISDENKTPTNPDASSGATQGQGKPLSQTLPSKGAKQTRRQKLELKKKERKAVALQRKRGSLGDAPGSPFLPPLASTPISVKTLTI